MPPPERLPRRAVRGLGAHSPSKPVRFTHSNRRNALVSDYNTEPSIKIDSQWIPYGFIFQKQNELND